jgi:gliding motility-associated-like protein
MKTCFYNVSTNCKIVLKFCFLFIILSTGKNIAKAQFLNNIDFEKGDFTGWVCWKGNVDELNNMNIITWRSTPPCINDDSSHILLSSARGAGLDSYGLFPRNSPNGSRYSVQLGNDGVGNRADGLSYTFTIPAGQNEFSIFYKYAIVLQNPGHSPERQPRFIIRVENLTDNTIIPCTPDPFITGNLPGFKYSAKQKDGIPVMYKDWAAASVNLDGLAGKMIRLFFLSTSCTRDQHFGYAYFDIEAKTSKNLDGNLFCNKDSALKLNAPLLYESYRWFNSANTTLGTQQSISFNPLPRNGDTVFVECIPYAGYGCNVTLIAILSDTLSVRAHAGADKEFCANPSIQLGAKAIPGELYNWLPNKGLSDSKIADPIVSPNASTSYILTVTSVGGGCRSVDTVNLVKKCDVIEIYVPSAFTPDGNAINDYLLPKLFGFSKLNYFRVYNRFGQLLYSMNSDQPGWDGKVKGKYVNIQTVVWILEAVDAYGQIHKRQGTTVLIR